MKVLVYGAGAVGCFLGGHLAVAGHEVTLLGRQTLAEAVTKSGLRLQQADGSLLQPDVRVVTSARGAFSDDSASYDFIAFTMKAYDTAPAILEMQDVLGFGHMPPPIVSFQNGVGNVESLRAAFGPEADVVAATLTTPVSSMEAGYIAEEKTRGAAVAVDSPAAQRVLQAFEGAALTVEAVEDGEALKWSKLMTNIIANATAAILDMSPGEIYADAELASIEQEALHELIAILDLAEINVVNLPGVPARLLKLAAGLPAWAFRGVMRPRVASARGEKPPSLQLSLRYGNERTEVAWLNGAVVQKADALERLVPVNHTLALIIADISTGRSPWEMYRHKPDMLVTAVRAARGKRLASPNRG